MKSEVFNFSRFWNYFKYDLKQMWRNHSKPALFIGGMELLLYVVWVLLALVFTGHWTGPGLAARCTVFVIAFTVLELYQTRTYGHLTLNEGLETKDLVNLSEGITPKGLTSLQFLQEIRKRLEVRLNA